MFSIASRATNLTQSIVEELGSSIVARTHPTGHRALTERKICDQFQVSRVTARESIEMLKAKGLLRSNTSQGTLVCPERHWNMMDPDVLRWAFKANLSEQALRECLQTRLAIEPMSAFYSALRASTSELKSLRETLAQLESSLGDELAFTEAEVAFHQEVLHASANRAFRQMSYFVEVSIRSDHYNNKNPATYLDGCNNVVTAINKRQAKAAKSAMRELLGNTSFGGIASELPP